MASFSSRLKQDLGQGISEYLILVFLVAVIVLVSVRVFGGSIECQFSNATNQIDGSSVIGCTRPSNPAAPLPAVKPINFVPPAQAPVVAPQTPPAIQAPPPAAPIVAAPVVSPPAISPPPPPAPPAAPPAEPSVSPSSTPVAASSPASTPSNSPTPTPSPTPRPNTCFFNCSVTSCKWLGQCIWDRCSGGGVSFVPVTPQRFPNPGSAESSYVSTCTQARTQADCVAIVLPTSSWPVMDANGVFVGNGGSVGGAEQLFCSGLKNGTREPFN